MNVIIRTLVVALTVTGSAAYINLSTVSAKPVAKACWAPVPTCPPDGKHTCGM